MAMTIRVAKPDDFSTAERTAYIDFVRSAGEVNAATLPGLVDDALALIMLHEDGEIIGSAAIKKPDKGYHEKVFTGAGIERLADSYMLELGWVHVHPDHAGKGHGRALIEAAIDAAGAAPIYATTKSAVMHHLLPQYAFEAVGKPYPSTQERDAEITVFVRPAPDAVAASFPRGMSLEEHRRSPDVSIEQHIAARAAALRRSLERRIPIYLDSRFWIMAREVEDGTSQRSDEREIVRLLNQMVDSGKAFCPISEPTFSELMKQGNEDQRAATARSAQRLSRGISILPTHECMVAEAEHLILGRLATGQTPERVPAWTSLAYVLGNMHVADTPFAAADELAIQKAFYDRMWDEPLTAIALSMDSETYTGSDELERQARDLTEANARHSAAMKSFAQVLESEFRGSAETIVERSPRLRSTFEPLERAIGRPPGLLAIAAISSVLMDEQQARSMPCAHVGAVVHALFRWEYRDKPMTANDLVDFRHAAAALSHCPLMLTEDGLRKTLSHRRMSLAAIHGTTVLSNRDEIASYLQQLAG